MERKEDISTEIDMVNQPPHYTQGKFETIDVIEDVVQHLDGVNAVLVGHILRYVIRFPFKNGVEDLRKAQFYLDRLIDKVGEE